MSPTQAPAMTLLFLCSLPCLSFLFCAPSTKAAQAAHFLLLWIVSRRLTSFLWHYSLDRHSGTMPVHFFLSCAYVSLYFVPFSQSSPAEQMDKTCRLSTRMTSQNCIRKLSSRCTFSALQRNSLIDWVSVRLGRGGVAMRGQAWSGRQIVLRWWS